MKKKPVIGFFNAADIVTMSGLFCSVLACLLIAQGHYIVSMIFYTLGLLCDTFDGRIARKLDIKEPHEKFYGVQLDSLCDAISFGVVPCVMAYFLGYNSLFDMIIYGLFAICGVIRLSYFNTEAALDTKNMKMDHFTGLPIPFSAMFFQLFLIIHLLTTSVDGNSVFTAWIFRLFFIVLGAGYILRFRFPKPSKTVLMFLGIWQITQFLALIIVCVAKSI